MAIRALDNDRLGHRLGGSSGCRHFLHLGLSVSKCLRRSLNLGLGLYLLGL
jgi:hypothetical protein